MRRLILSVAMLGLWVGGALATPMPARTQNATYFHKVTYCQTHCYYIGNQQHCNTLCN